MREPTPEEKAAFKLRILELKHIFACRRGAYELKDIPYQQRCEKALAEHRKRNQLGGPHQ